MAGSDTGKEFENPFQPQFGKKPCRACTDFKSWMKQHGKDKGNKVIIIRSN